VNHSTTPFPGTPRSGRPGLSSLHLVSLRDGRKLCARRRGGSREGTVVLLHGLLDSSEGWLELCQELNCPHVAVDIPGFGHSDARSNATIADYALDVAHGLRALHVERFTLVGHSLGGAVAAAVAELMPADIDALILLAPAGFGRVRLAELATAPGLGPVVHQALPRVLSSRLLVTAGYVAMVTNGRMPRAELVERVTSSARHVVEGTWEAIRAIAEAGRSPHGLHCRRVGYTGPVTAVWGDCDRVVPLCHEKGVRSAFPQARIEVWRGMGHHPMRERLGELVALIAETGTMHRSSPRANGAPAPSPITPVTKAA
jgi:pimeloyl-ACP methyl ester carboxylesterase